MAGEGKNKRSCREQQVVKKTEVCFITKIRKNIWNSDCLHLFRLFEFLPLHIESKFISLRPLNLKNSRTHGNKSKSSQCPTSNCTPQSIPVLTVLKFHPKYSSSSAVPQNLHREHGADNKLQLHIKQCTIALPQWMSRGNSLIPQGNLQTWQKTEKNTSTLSGTFLWNPSPCLLLCKALVSAVFSRAYRIKIFLSASADI